MLTSFRYILLAAFLISLISGCGVIKNKGLITTGGGTLQDVQSKIFWQQKRSPLFSTAAEATNYVKKLDLGGYSDWRLPTNEELFDFYFDFDFGNANADKLGTKIEGSYWFINSSGTIKTGAWKDDGNICEITRGYEDSKAGYVRAVRP